jgi:hypothetical protein
VTRCVSGGSRVIQRCIPGDPARTGLTGGGDPPDQCDKCASRDACSVVFSSRFR